MQFVDLLHEVDPLASVTRAGGGECVLPKSTCSESPDEDTATTTVLILLIMLFALFFESLLKLISLYAPASLRPVISRVLTEFAELGLMSLVVYIPSDNGWFVSLSTNLFGDCTHLLHLIHETHFLVLWASLSFLGFVIILTISSIYWQHQWDKFEIGAQNNIDPEVECNLYTGVWNKVKAFFFAGATPLEYCLIRECFIADVNLDEKKKAWNIDKLKRSFPFNEYLQRQQAEFYVGVVNIMALSWISLFCVVAACYGLTYTSLETGVIVSICTQAGLLLASLALQSITVQWYLAYAPKVDHTSLKQRQETISPASIDEVTLSLDLLIDQTPLHDNGSFAEDIPLPASARTRERWHSSFTNPLSARTSSSPTPSFSSRLSSHCNETTVAGNSLPMVRVKTWDPKAHKQRMRFAIQIIMLLTGVNMAFFIDTGAAYLLEPCGLGGVAISCFLFTLYLTMHLFQAMSLLQTVRVYLLLLCTSSFKSYTSITWVLRMSRLQALFSELMEEGAKEGKMKRLANKLFAREARKLFSILEEEENGFISVVDLRNKLDQKSDELHLKISKDDIIGVLCEMDEDGDGIIDFNDFYRGLKDIFNR